MNLSYPHRFSVAPMMDWTTSECRQFHRLLTRRALLYTEMVTTGALIHGQRDRFLAYTESEHPLALQLGGSDARDLATCAKMAEQWGYDEVNLNAGCPSDRVQNGMIGAILMAHGALVRDGLKAMRDSVSLPITLKHRIGIDDFDSYEFLRDFVGITAESGCDTYIVHARKAILSGLSPKENREIPPLDYDRVKQLKADFPALNIIINGGLKDHAACLSLLDDGLDGVMLGREAYQNPLILQSVDPTYYGQATALQTQSELVSAYVQWVDLHLQQGKPLKYALRHTLGLFQGQPGARRFRRVLSEGMHKPDAGMALLERALSEVELLDAEPLEHA
ncbi:tRNA dihydrouridine(20/20a) synthase DusA [Saccharospirillum alexandrii]|uniref:tRNA dihydrouridine(20/20a) synthase DusA n=1 Tax=Saccharospirillum alexandrii TaxID=2448477 RepID=UPI000FDCA6CB|nr:tRNA dihydrouridine(20/20a) synthase DusA [Saccharospirillum alexandrii]